MTLEGAPWFVAADVLDALGYPSSSRTMILRKLDPEEVALKRIEGTRGRDQNVINESGLYKLLMRSDKPQAKAFQDWVTKEVLPSPVENPLDLLIPAPAPQQCRSATTYGQPPATG